MLKLKFEVTLEFDAPEISAQEQRDIRANIHSLIQRGMADGLISPEEAEWGCSHFAVAPIDYIHIPLQDGTGRSVVIKNDTRLLGLLRLVYQATLKANGTFGTGAGDDVLEYADTGLFTLRGSRV